MQKPTISVPEMAAELGIGLTKAYQLVHEPNFPTIRIGTRILIPVDRFHEWFLFSETYHINSCARCLSNYIVCLALPVLPSAP